ncbi:hypothetical protein ABL78_2872 [Leptomonas seymouri]|uniref:Uncharacterized protein n=1 Tax=Leptomonas seymouri TaxID=5684 RepID=A0A0N0P6U7_LEPSE|nr:hypothetical protein ABL78_2872 [Leptomonas seymouri]|eukprot:KPI88046.1 hypothetical protein ABL78_2872 [Leptomonas seymouri]
MAAKSPPVAVSATSDMREATRHTAYQAPDPPLPPAKSPSPPASTCRRLSYESAQTRSNTRASSTYRSRSTPQPLQQPPRPIHGVLPTPVHTSVLVTHTRPRVAPSMPPPASPKAPVDDANPGSPPAAAPCGALKRSAASTPDFLQYSSEPSSPSPAPAAAATPLVQLCGNTAGAGAVDKTRSSSYRPHLRDASPFSCFLTNQTRTSGVTECDSNAVTSGEKSSPASPPSSNRIRDGADHTGELHGHQNQLKSGAAIVAETTRCTAPTATACTPPSKAHQHPHVSLPVAHAHSQLSLVQQPHHASHPRPPHRSHSASSRVRGGSPCMQPAPRLHSGLKGTSPFAVDQLAMPRRPTPAAMSNVSNSNTLAQRRLPPPPPPQVQLARPSGLYRHSHLLSAASTSMAASQLPGGAATYDRLQLPQKSHLVRMPSSSADGTRRRTPSVPGTPSSPFKRRSSSATAASRNAASASAAGAASATTAQTRPRTSSGAFTYVTRGGEAHRHASMDVSATTNAAPAVPCGTGSARSSGFSAQKQLRPHAGTATAAGAAGPLRSNSAPVRRHAASAAAVARASAGAGVSAKPMGNRFSSNGPLRPHANSRTPAVFPPSSLPDKAAAAPRDRTARTRAASATRTPAPLLPVTTAAAVLRKGRAEAKDSSKVGRAPSSPAASREPSRIGDRGACSAVAASDARTRRAAVGGGGVPTQRARPVVSSSQSAASPSNRSSAATTRRVRAAASRTSTSANLCSNADVNSSAITVSATQSSMITVEESTEFLQEFQRMNQRELVLFGTLLATVANERQMNQQQRRADGGDVAAAAAAGTPDALKRSGSRQTKTANGESSMSIVVQSAEEVSVWTCTRPALENPSPQPQEGGTTAGAANEAAASMAREPAPQGEGERKAKDETEVVVLVRRSCTRATPSVTPSPPRQLEFGSDEKPQQRSPSPTPSAPTYRRFAAQLEPREPAENISNASGSNFAASPTRGFEARPSPPHLQPSSENARAAAVVKPLSVKDGRALTSSGLQPRSASDANVKSAPLSPATHRKLHGGNRMSGSAAAALARPSDIRMSRQHPSPSSLSSRSRRRRLRSGAHGAAVAAAPTCLHARLPSEQQEHPQLRQQSVMSYTDIRSYSRSEDHDANGNSNKRNAFKLSVREYSPPSGEGSHEKSMAAVAGGEAVKDAPPPLAALRRAKEIASEQAAALVQRQRERQEQQQKQQLQSQENGERAGGGGSKSNASPSIFSSCGSPSDSSMGRTSSAMGAAVSDVAEVRMSAAQLQLLIDSSRSRHNWERYQPLQPPQE